MNLRGMLASLRDICLFRGGPEELPYAPGFLAALLAACVALEVGFDLREGIHAGLIAASVVGGLATVVAVALLLRGRAKPERFVQTTSALAVVYLLFGFAKGLLGLLLPIKAWQAEFASSHGHLPTPTGDQMLVALAITVLGVWQLCVWIGILRRALEVPVAGGVLAWLALVFVNMLVMLAIASAAGVA